MLDQLWRRRVSEPSESDETTGAHAAEEPEASVTKEASGGLQAEGVPPAGISPAVIVLRASGSYKYQVHLTVLPDCPPPNFVPQTMTAFRFVYSPDPESNSFKPQGIKKPERMFQGDPSDRCSLMAISIFTTAAKAKKKFTNLNKKYPARDLLGTHIAEVQITPAHGVVSPPSSSGHMDLHEFNGCDLSTVSRVLEAL